MREENIGKWKLLIEPEETKKAYSKIRYGNPEGCSCLGCKNYLLVKDVYYSKEAIEIFSKLGIIPLRESELYQQFPV